MPLVDYNDPEYDFPRLQVRLQFVEADAYWIKIWLWNAAGDGPHLLMNGKRAGRDRDAHEVIREIYGEAQS